jgi:hypothetical protein
MISQGPRHCHECPLPRFDGTCTARWAADGEIRADRRIRRGDDSRETDAVTNVAKHFKWEPRGKRRIHAKPNTREIAACWLDAELAVIEPEASCAWARPRLRRCSAVSSAFPPSVANG